MYSLALLKATRQKFISLIDELSIEELNEIPKGFNNNIAWNFGHAVVSAYLLAYVRTGVNPSIQIPLADKYKIGTKPESFIGKDEIESLKKLSTDFFIKIEKDISENKFQSLVSYNTISFGVEMTNIEEYLAVIWGHETLHYTTALCMKKMIVGKNIF
jgi:hypothetical protein